MQTFYPPLRKRAGIDDSAGQSPANGHEGSNVQEGLPRRGHSGLVIQAAAKAAASGTAASYCNPGLWLGHRHAQAQALTPQKAPTGADGAQGIKKQLSPNRRQLGCDLPGASYELRGGSAAGIGRTDRSKAFTVQPCQFVPLPSIAWQLFSRAASSSNAAKACCRPWNLSFVSGRVGSERKASPTPAGPWPSFIGLPSH